MVHAVQEPINILKEILPKSNQVVDPLQLADPDLLQELVLGLFFFGGIGHALVKVPDLLGLLGQEALVDVPEDHPLSSKAIFADLRF